MKRGIIYLITNRINGKMYVGQTTTPLSYRFTNHKSDARNNRGYYLASAIRRYGEENFTISVILECNECDLNINEIEQIKLLNTKAPNGYNLTDGGDICFRRLDLEPSDVIEKFYELKTASAVAKYFKTDIKNITKILKDNNIHYGT